MIKLCICLVGQMRTYDDLKITNSYKYLYNYDIDLYIFTWKNRGYSNHHGITNYSVHSDDIIREETLISHYSQFGFKIKKIIIDDFEEWYNSLTDEMKSIYKTPFRNHSKVTTSVPIQYKYQQITQYLNEDYDNILITRPDMAFLSDLPVVNPKDDSVYFKCICNRCIAHGWIGNKKTLVKQLNNIFDNYLINYNKISSYNENNRDENELIIYHSAIKNIHIVCIDGSFVEQILYCK